jgi:hypothetical protein
LFPPTDIYKIFGPNLVGVSNGIRELFPPTDIYKIFGPNLVGVSNGNSDGYIQDF